MKLSCSTCLFLLLVLLSGCGQQSSFNPKTQGYSNQTGKPLENFPPTEEVIHDGKPLSYWIKQVTDPDIEKRKEAIFLLGQVGSKGKNAIPALIGTLRDDTAFVRALAARSLGSFGPDAKDAIPILVKLLRDPDPVVYKNASEALSNIGPAAIPALTLLVDSENTIDQKEGLITLAMMGEVAIPEIIQALKSKYTVVRCNAASMLLKFGPKAKNAVPALTEALQSEDNVLSVLAARALVKIDLETTATRKTVLELLGHKDQLVRFNVAKELASLQEEAIPFLGEALKNPNPLARDSAVLALGDIALKNKEFLPTLIATLADENDEVRVTAALALVKIGPEAKAAIPALQKILDKKSTKSPNIFINVINALNKK